MDPTISLTVVDLIMETRLGKYNRKMTFEDFVGVLAAVSARHLRKPYREATGFLPGDVLSLVGTRTQLSNVPTKLYMQRRG